VTSMVDPRVAGWLLPPLQVNASWARRDSPLCSPSIVLIPNIGFTTEIERWFSFVPYVRHECPRHCASLKLVSRQPRATRMTAANTCFRKSPTYPVTQPHHGWYLASNLLSTCQKTFKDDVPALPCRCSCQISVLSASCI